ncbi:DUF3558 domain-containing protein [Streptomyces lavendofoliae]|uniref:DUF3558 domain-containing protein n=1 Tax=Streptomyces lavendofoliae TaxID=67314 RepID=A0A918I203_9ACTN|nr:DUF3558 domain-containing protein [Streptomyces lavendofoliae]GGU60082.1 hypothetical protein GCM10010274_56150 [Streptomyces lavendofoliae]
MQRRAYVPGVAALLAALTVGVTSLTGCSAGSGPDGSTADSKAGDTADDAGRPGKYRTLLEPCGSIQRSTLRDLLPGAAQLPEQQRERVYRGTAAVTYDTDRRAGCSWKTDGPDASHQLTVDFERVVSYDPAVSDDDRAQQVYAEKEAAAGLPAAVPPSGAAPTATPAAPSPAKAPPSPRATAPTGAASAAGTAGSPSPGDGESTAPEGLEPRVLADLADAAFLDDVLARAGSTAQHRTVSVVFRTSNVIVTIRYGEQPARVTEVPDSKELQEKAQGLARNLAEELEE